MPLSELCRLSAGRPAKNKSSKNSHSAVRSRIGNSQTRSLSTAFALRRKNIIYFAVCKLYLCWATVFLSLFPHNVGGQKKKEKEKKRRKKKRSLNCLWDNFARVMTAEMMCTWREECEWKWKNFCPIPRSEMRETARDSSENSCTNFFVWQRYIDITD